MPVVKMVDGLTCVDLVIYSNVDGTPIGRGSAYVPTRQSAASLLSPSTVMVSATTVYKAVEKRKAKAKPRVKKSAKKTATKKAAKS